MQGDKFSAQVAALEAEVKSLKAENAGLSKDNKVCYGQIRAKDKELDAAAKEVAQARQAEIQNKVSQHCRLHAIRAATHNTCSYALFPAFTSSMSVHDHNQADIQHRIIGSLLPC